MPYIMKTLFLTVSYIILMSGISDLKMFFLSLIIFSGSICFDMYFSYGELEYVSEGFSHSVIKGLISFIAIISVIFIIIGILGLGDIIYVTSIRNVKYIIFKDTGVGLSKIKFKVKSFLIILLLELGSCLPDFILHKIKKRGDTKKSISKIDEVEFIENE